MISRKHSFRFLLKNLRRREDRGERRRGDSRRGEETQGEERRLKERRLKERRGDSRRGEERIGRGQGRWRRGGESEKPPLLHSFLRCKKNFARNIACQYSPLNPVIPHLLFTAFIASFFHYELSGLPLWPVPLFLG
jgi:hypothetical protein